MNGVHDMGGLQGFGPVVAEAQEPLFHADWERRALALTLAMGATGQWNIDLSRSARESLPPAVYLGSSYYAIWLRAMEQLMRERGLADAEELQDGRMRTPARPVARVLRAEAVDAALARGAPTERPAPAPARFAVGQQVRARNMHPIGHTRLPRYVRGHTGTIVLVHGAHVFADVHASQPLPPFPEQPHWLYTVVFDARELWGPEADATVQVSVDAWEPYLEVPA
ncbi:MAG: nitrile hydratase subunit beta [Burkholderiaceae bacterium]|nr:nitrile hydratase subunit beta [Rhodoferax sp.]MCB2041451.1 nitrile hydratase subunit beta [Rhodoferax sp.]MCP5263527.1 nitrile hydratase subunit beta [Rhodoferax sp.]MCW5630833.1 nitrile hydratase subunit beta [Rhodoferax sp.]